MRTTPWIAVGLAGAIAVIPASARSASLAGEAAALSGLVLAGDVSGGFFLAAPVGTGGVPDGLLVHVDAAGATTWALRAERRALRGVAGLPDGGALVVGAGGLATRIDGAGGITWQVEWTGTWSSSLDAVACSGWDCVVGGTIDGRGVIAMLDGSSGDVTAQAEGDDAIPHALAWARDGSVLAAGLHWDYPMGTATIARLERDLSPRWARFIGHPEWQDSPGAFTFTAVAGLTEHADGSISATWNNQYGEGFGASHAGDGTTVFAFTTGGTIPSRPVATAAGAILVATGGLRIESFVAGVATNAVSLGIGGSTQRALTRLSDGRLAAVVGRTVAWMDDDLRALDACTDARTAWLPLPWGPAAPMGGIFDLPAAATVLPRPASVTWRAACLTPCLLACESACEDGLDDDANGTIDCDDVACAIAPACETGDLDGDGVINRDDCAPGDATAPSAPGPARLIVTSWRAGSSVVPRLSWAPTRIVPTDPEPPLGDIVRGRLADLRASGTTSLGDCVVRRTRDGQWSDRDGASLRGDLWYLVRPANACGPGSWDSPDLDASSPCS